MGHERTVSTHLAFWVRFGMGRRPPVSNQSRAQHYTQSTATKLGYKPEERRKKKEEGGTE